MNIINCIPFTSLAYPTEVYIPLPAAEWFHRFPKILTVEKYFKVQTLRGVNSLTSLLFVLDCVFCRTY